MARPAKHEQPKRDHFLRVRLTPDEHAAFLARAAQAQMAPSDYARHMVLDGRVEIVHTPPALSIEAIMELNRIGVNLNQLTRIGNATGDMPARLNPLLERITDLLDEAMDRDIDRLEAWDAKNASDPAVLTGE